MNCVFTPQRNPRCEIVLSDHISKKAHGVGSTLDEAVDPEAERVLKFALVTFFVSVNKLCVHVPKDLNVK